MMLTTMTDDEDVDSEDNIDDDYVFSVITCPLLPYRCGHLCQEALPHVVFWITSKRTCLRPQKVLSMLKFWDTDVSKRPEIMNVRPVFKWWT